MTEPRADLQEPKLEIDVCIATFKRPESLARLLHSVSEQSHPEGPRVVVCVADNDAARSAEPVCKEFSSDRVSVRYVSEPVANIAAARNASLRLGSSEFVAIVDDDEEVGPQWLDAYAACAASFSADVLHGPVKFRFEQACPPLVAGCRIFSRGGPLATGTASGYARSTTNCYFKRSVLELVELEPGVWFDPIYGRSGSEDSDFFDRLERAGSSFAWCQDALTFEDVPPERTTLRWLISREARFGMNLAHRERRDMAGRKYFFGAALRHRHFIGSCARALAHCLVLRKQAAFDHFLTAAFFFGFLVHHYTGRRFDAYW